MPVLPLNGVDTPANAVILRIENTPALTQAATIATVLARRHGHGVWLPCGSNASFNLCANRTWVGGRFFLAWGSVLRNQAIVAECKDLKSSVGCPGEGPNPWPRAAGRCRRWLRICNAEEIHVNQFDVVQGDARGKWFGKGQTA
jgi:hypothetical protein